MGWRSLSSGRTPRASGLFRHGRSRRLTSARQLGVRLARERKLSNERQRSPRGRVVRVHEAARPERPVEHLVVADHRAADTGGQRLAVPLTSGSCPHGDRSISRTNLLGMPQHRASLPDQERGRAVVERVPMRRRRRRSMPRARGRSSRRRGARARRSAAASRARGARRSAARAAFDASSARLASTAKSGAAAIVGSFLRGGRGFHTGDAMAVRAPFATWSLRRISPSTLPVA